MSRDRIEEDLALAKEAMDAREVPISDARRATIWARVDEARDRRPFRPWILALPAAAAAAAIAVISIAPSPDAPSPAVREGRLSVAAVGEDVPLQRSFSALAPSRIDLSGAELRIAPESSLILSSRELVTLESGTIELAISRAAPRVIATNEARIEAVAGRFAVEAREGRTRVMVHEGSVVATTFGSTRTLVPGYITEFPPPARVEKTAPVEPPPVPVEEKPPQKPADVAPAHRASGDQAVSNADRTAAAEVDEARRIVANDAPRARQMAEAVLEVSDSRDVRAGAWMVLADAHRLQGERSKAAQIYGQVAAEKGRFQEEAFLRQAQLEERATKALAILKTADIAIGNGLLKPERAALSCDLLLKLGRPDEAAEILERTAGRALALQAARVRVAEALADRAPERARLLVEPVVEHAPADLSARARAILEAPGAPKNR